MSQDLVKPQTLRGFRDYLPQQMLPREELVECARRVYRSYGFSPIDTPALEYSKVLLGKGSEESDKQLFRFKHGKRDVAMRFDLTVPFARFAAQHYHDLGTPFKRYHVGPVWRGERPQQGRYREFWQCDFDTIGTESNLADVETLLVIHDLLVEIGNVFAEGKLGFSIRVNNRRLLNGLLEKIGLSEHSVGVLRALDKLPKIGADAVVEEMTGSVGTDESQARRVLELAGLTGTPDEILDQLQPMLAGNETGEEGIARLRELFDAATTAGIPAERVALDVSIARGLDYYTGTIYETFLDDLPGIGSICSGGRYDDLAALFTRERLPGVGASLGLDRLLAALDELNLLPEAATPAEVLVTVIDAECIGDYLRIARTLRAAGIPTEVYPEPKALGKQLKYANRKGFPWALIANADEFAAGTWRLKNLHAGEQTVVPEAELVEHLRAQRQG